MRAVALTAFGSSDVLEPLDLPRPRPARGEVLVRVVAAGVDPADASVRRGDWEGVWPHRFPLIPGWDVAGVVEEFGDGTSHFRKGDRVWGFARKPILQWGCYAEYVAVDETALAQMPSKLLFEEAAAVPMATLAAAQALFDRGALAADQTVLIHDAAGGVGHFAVQLARIAGARAIGTTPAQHLPFVLGLGAEAAVDPEREDLIEGLRRLQPDGVDLVLDAGGRGDATRDSGLLRPGGRLVSLARELDLAAAASRGVRAVTLFPEPDGEELGRFARLVDQGKLRPHVSKIFSLKQAAEAHALLEQGDVAGKVVLNL
jgi:NADPH2:quinone reductase